MISFTEKAIEKIIEISESEGVGHTTVRVKCKGGGCAGFQFDLCFDNQIDDFDEVFDQNGIKVICDPVSFQYLDETSVDYIDGLIDAGFKFNVPKAISSCGCQKSFAF